MADQEQGQAVKINFSCDSCDECSSAESPVLLTEAYKHQITDIVDRGISKRQTLIKFKHFCE